MSAEFTEWNSRKYLERYYPNDFSDDQTTRFLAGLMEHGLIPDNVKAIDIGTGPTVCYWVSISQKLMKVNLTDYLESNLAEQKKWVDNDPQAYNWDSYIKFSLTLQGMNGTEKEIEQLKKEARSKVGRYLHCDVTANDPVGEGHRGKYGLVTTMYCADSMCSNKEQWRQCMRNIFSLLSSGGSIIIGALKGCEYYCVDENKFPSANIDEEDVKQLLLESNFDQETMLICSATDGLPLGEQEQKKAIEEYNYDQVILAFATLQK
jgi:hypothetical protein